MISLLDYGAGNVRSLRNAIHKLGYALTDIERPEDILKAERLLFPGVGSFGAAMERLHALGYVEPLREYLRIGDPTGVLHVRRGQSSPTEAPNRIGTGGTLSARGNIVCEGLWMMDLLRPGGRILRSAPRLAQGGGSPTRDCLGQG